MRSLTTNFQIGATYAFVKYCVLALAFLKTLLIAYYLGPELLGTYALVILIVEYLNYINLGVFNSMTRDISLFLTDKNKEREIDLTEGNAISFSLIASIFLLAVLFLFSFMSNSVLPEEVAAYIPIMFVLVVIYQLKQFILRHLRLFENFFLLGAIEFMAQLLNLIGVVLFIESYLIDAVVFSILISNIFLLLFGFAFSRKVKLTFNFQKIKYLIKAGFPILLYSIFLLLLTSIDRVMIGFFYSDIKALGYYQLGLSLAVGLFTVFNAITFLFLPKWLRFFSLNDNEMTSLKIESLKEQTYFLELLLVVLSLLGIIAIPYFIKTYLVEFEVSIIIMQFLLMSSVVLHMTFFAITYLNSNNHQVKTLPSLLIAVFFSAIMNYLFISLGYGLYGIAFAKILSLFIYGFLIFKLLLKISELPFLLNFFKIYIRIIVFFSFLSFIVYEQISIWFAFIPLVCVYSKAVYRLWHLIRMNFKNLLIT